MKCVSSIFSLLLFICGLIIPSIGLADTYKSSHYRIKVETVAINLKHPWGLTFLPDGSFLVTERGGTLRRIAANGKRGAPIKGLPEIAAGGQGGLLDIALDPNYSTNKILYFTFSESGQGGTSTAVGRARYDQKKNALENLSVIFRQLPKSQGGRHFGSRLVFARDGRLFITLGDRGQRDRVQDFTIHRGQVIRINPDGSVPKDNPFLGKDGYQPETWSHGHRNPQGATLHPKTGAYWTVEHGAAGGDEINKPQAGRNYGWPIISYGTHYSGAKIGVGTQQSGLEQPVYYWDPSIAPSGLSFYFGPAFPKWRGNLFVGALKDRLLVRLEMDGDRVVKEERLLQDLDERIRDVRQGPDGYLYILTDAFFGRLLRLKPD